jgi:hypothetical protein
MTVYVFAYGSLLNIHETKELTHPKKIYPCLIKGLKRSLNVDGKNHLVMGVKDVKTSQCNGILIQVTPEELANLQKRERLYQLKTIVKSRVEFPYSPKIQFQAADEVLCFYPQVKYVLTRKALVTKTISTTYVNTCKKGAAAISPEFLEDFIATTHV